MLAAVLAAACQLPTPTPSPADVHIENGTTAGIRIVVNGEHAADIAGGTSIALSAGAMPAGDWSIQALLPSGRVLVALDVPADATVRRVPNDRGGAGAGHGARADLSCGRIDVWVGAPMLGPPPGPGEPGDCD